MFCQKHTLTSYRSLWRGRGKSIFVFIFMIANFMLVWNHSKSCTPSRNGGQLTNRYRKTKVGAYYNDEVPWGCRRFGSRKGSATRIPCRSDPGLREVSPMGIKLSILRPGLVKPEPGIHLYKRQLILKDLFLPCKASASLKALTAKAKRDIPCDSLGTTHLLSIQLSWLCWK